jgi:predicted amidohydrolase
MWKGLCLFVALFAGLAGAAYGDQSVRVGLLQMNARYYDKSFNLETAERLIREAHRRGAKIVCTPESAVQGYPRFPLPTGQTYDDPEVIELKAKILAAAESIPGPSTRKFAALARELGLWIVFGMDENRNGRLFNTAVLIDPEGAIVGTYSKVHLQNWMTGLGVNHGDDFPVWDVEIAGVKTRIGIAICYDIQHPESARELVLGGAELIFNPYCTTDFARPLLVHLYQTRALENRVYIARVNYGAPHNNGTSAVFDFEGYTYDQLDQAEGILVNDLNLTRLREIRAVKNPVYGPDYRRPSAYKRLRGAGP